jgi:perosamine synthetase
MFKIPVYQPSLTGNEKKYVNECLDSSWISSKGKFIAEFEEKFADYTGVSHAASVCNGTVAIHLALVALGVGEGDEVIVPTLTYIASVNAIKYTGATPVFVDSDKDTWQLSVADVEKKITTATKAIMAVHLYGNASPVAELRDVCDKHSLFLIEDCAEALGTYHHNKHVGTFGDISTFSFFGNKTITTGEGGMVVTNNTTIHDRVVHYKGQGLAKHRQYWHDVVGYNYRMTNIQAAIGLAQLEQADTFLAAKAELASFYENSIDKTRFFTQKITQNSVHSYWMYSLAVTNDGHRDLLRNHLEANGIETRPLFYPVHTMPMYAGRYQHHPNAEYIGWRGLNIPSYPAITPEQRQFIVDTINSFQF